MKIKTFNIFVTSFVIVLIGYVCLPQTASAYVGPGTGLSAIGAFLALVAGIIVAILGFLWYPMKRLFGKKKQQEPDQIKNEEE